jgi:hypothetical protein
MQILPALTVPIPRKRVLLKVLTKGKKPLKIQLIPKQINLTNET